MVKFGKNKFKALNKVAKAQKVAATSPGVSNKILKKKINAEKKVTFQKEVLIKEAVSGNNKLVKNITASELRNEPKKAVKDKATDQTKVSKPKTKAVEKKNKRLKTQINDTKLMLKLMKKT